MYGGLNAFFLLMDEPKVYGLPSGPSAALPSRNNVGGYVAGLVAAALAVIGGVIAFRRRAETPGGPPAEPAREPESTPVGGR